MTSLCSRLFHTPTPPTTLTLSSHLLNIAKKVTFIALSAFAWTLNASHFLFGFIAGATWALLTPSTQHTHCHSGGGCSDGTLETLTGVQLPAPVALTAGAAILWTHLGHHPVPFVSLTGFYAGALTARHISQIIYRT